MNTLSLSSVTFSHKNRNRPHSPTSSIIRWFLLQKDDQCNSLLVSSSFFSLLLNNNNPSSSSSSSSSIPCYLMSQSEFKKRLKVLMNKPENQVCSDCPERQPRWASLIVPPPGSAPGSLPIGAFCCLECSGSHRRLGVHISFVRSITLDSCKYNII